MMFRSIKAYLSIHSRLGSTLPLLALSLSLVACSGDAVRPTVPSWPVWLELSLDVRRELLIPGGMVRILRPSLSSDRLGYGGVLVVRSLVEEAFFAYDLACPIEVSTETQLELHDLEVRCPECGSRFDVLSGAGVPTFGPARHPLRRYSTLYLSSTRAVRITN